MEPQSEAAWRAWRTSAQSGVAAFLSARLDEEERIARAATDGPWRVDNEEFAEAIYGADGSTVVGGGRWGGEASVFESTEDALHIALHNPTRVLADAAAKRRIVVLHRAVRTTTLVHQDGSLADPVEVCHACDANTTDADWPEMPCPTLSALAEPYASHPDYQEGWRL
ncbi:DUF6221 family protein (plasmid) [Streptomyces sp. NBC_01259]|uniref:DUF6221 family protein n=1 Tax=Streptomyces sp. NBC_01259 TaxID=2903800 RepID=UPI00325404B1